MHPINDRRENRIDQLISVCIYIVCYCVSLEGQPMFVHSPRLFVQQCGCECLQHRIMLVDYSGRMAARDMPQTLMELLKVVTEKLLLLRA